MRCFLRFVGFRCDIARRSRLILPRIEDEKTMLEFCKTVLKRVSFDRRLFARELKKSFSWLSHEDALALKSWAMATYSNKYAQLIVATFAAVHTMDA